MASRLEKLQGLNPIQTQLAQGYFDPEFSLQNILPIVPVDSENGSYPVGNKDMFKLYETRRAIKAKSNRLPSSDVDLASYMTSEEDAYEPIDYREANNARNLFNVETFARQKAQKAVQRGWEKRGMDLITTVSNYASGHYTTLSGLNQWTSKDTSNPIDDIEAGKVLIRQKSGVPYKELSIAMGQQAWDALKYHPDLLSIYQYTRDKILTPDLAVAAFGVKEIFIVSSVYATDAGVFTDMMADDVVIYYNNPSTRTLESTWVPTFGYTIRWNQSPFADEFTEDGGKINNMRYTDNYVCKIMSNFAGYLIKDVAA